MMTSIASLLLMGVVLSQTAAPAFAAQLPSDATAGKPIAPVAPDAPLAPVAPLAPIAPIAPEFLPRRHVRGTCP